MLSIQQLLHLCNRRKPLCLFSLLQDKLTMPDKNETQQVRSRLKRTPLRESFCESGEGVRLPRERGWPPGKSGKLPGKSGELPGNLRIAVRSRSERTSGKVAENFRGSSGNLRGSAGTFQKLGGAWPAPSGSPNVSPTLELSPRPPYCNSVLTLTC